MGNSTETLVQASSSYNKNCLFFHALEMMEEFFAVLYVSHMGLTHCYKTVVFTFLIHIKWHELTAAPQRITLCSAVVANAFWPLWSLECHRSLHQIKAHIRFDISYLLSFKLYLVLFPKYITFKPKNHSFIFHFILFVLGTWPIAEMWHKV